MKKKLIITAIVIIIVCLSIAGIVYGASLKKESDKQNDKNDKSDKYVFNDEVFDYYSEAIDEYTGLNWENTLNDEEEITMLRNRILEKYPEKTFSDEELDLAVRTYERRGCSFKRYHSIVVGETAKDSPRITVDCVKEMMGDFESVSDGCTVLDMNGLVNKLSEITPPDIETGSGISFYYFCTDDSLKKYIEIRGNALVMSIIYVEYDNDGNVIDFESLYEIGDSQGREEHGCLDYIYNNLVLKK